MFIVGTARINKRAPLEMVAEKLLALSFMRNVAGAG